jgi:hypothetical protein
MALVERTLAVASGVAEGFSGGMAISVPTVSGLFGRCEKLVV